MVSIPNGSVSVGHWLVIAWIRSSLYRWHSMQRLLNAFVVCNWSRCTVIDYSNVAISIKRLLSYNWIDFVGMILCRCILWYAIDFRTYYSYAISVCKVLHKRNRRERKIVEQQNYHKFPFYLDLVNCTFRTVLFCKFLLIVLLEVSWLIELFRFIYIIALDFSTNSTDFIRKR